MGAVGTPVSRRTMSVGDTARTGGDGTGGDGARGEGTSPIRGSGWTLGSGSGNVSRRHDGRSAN
jgi:hypothetical protein